MARLPPPPPSPVLAAIPPVWEVVPAGTLLWRLYFRGGPYPTTWNRFRHFGPTSARFDHHATPKREQSRGILYTATTILTCVAEVFQQTGVIDTSLDEPAIVGFRTRVELRLLDLTELWPTRAGASMAISSGSHARARDWSRAIYAAYPDADGLWYCSAMNANAPALALYERAVPTVPDLPAFHAALADPKLLIPLGRLAAALNYRIVVPVSS